jgi:putative FmdB family regulatory protein
MPTYEYLCDACEHQFEEYQSILAEPLRKCPECGRKKLRRMIGPGAAIIFKGSGFYQTDYRSESYKKAASADKLSDKPVDKPADSSSSNGNGAKASSNGKTTEGKVKSKKKE